MVIQFLFYYIVNVEHIEKKLRYRLNIDYYTLSYNNFSSLFTRLDMTKQLSQPV